MLLSACQPNKAIIISTHILEEVGAVCSRAIIIARGKIVADATPAELERQAPSGKLDDVFRDLTIGDERRNRIVGGKASAASTAREDEDSGGPPPPRAGEPASKQNRPSRRRAKARGLASGRGTGARGGPPVLRG